MGVCTYLKKQTNNTHPPTKKPTQTDLPPTLLALDITYRLSTLFVCIRKSLEEDWTCGRCSLNMCTCGSCCPWRLYRWCICVHIHMYAYKCVWVREVFNCLLWGCTATMHILSPHSGSIKTRAAPNITWFLLAPVVVSHWPQFSCTFLQLTIA